MNKSQNNTAAAPISTGHGTVDVPWSEDSKSSLQDNQGISSTSNSSRQGSNNQKEDQNQEDQEHHYTGFGHATQHQHSPRSIKRDLNNI
ncbi:hypothetical protein INT46_010479 [Mucor plumbeus]|uniref:Uncharacterized protein n=1 Tax=Mucor plumbeus TaxID=97098 RepID=A0A8H7RNL8_9FUNG|nr:hypothetical protein INT46_010479 [Mucor plumbeus]